MTPQVITVTEFVTIINETLTFAYPQVIIEGEVSSFKVNQGKFVFFDLKDSGNVLNCFMMAFALKLPIEDGMKIRVTATPKITKYSKFSLTVKDIELAGEGQLRRALELLKKKLQSEGLFDPSRKRPLPAFPQRIGLITSGTSAAYADFTKILGARWGGLEVVLADVTVQGATAPDQIVGAIEYFNHLANPVDVLVLIRGGGSLEDLIAFSTEPVARAVAASRTPIVVGVGHEVDTSLADYAADVRAATPTDAARLVVPDRQEIFERIQQNAARQNRALIDGLIKNHQRVDLALGRLEAGLRHPRERIATGEAKLVRGLQSLQSNISAQHIHTITLAARLSDRTSSLIRSQRDHTASLERLLRGIDPKAVLARGYAIVSSDTGVIREPADAPAGTALMIQLAKGTLGATATNHHDD